MKKIIISGAILIFLLGGLLTVRFLFGGDEDTWLCVNGQWIEHGHPSTPIPQKPCSK